MKVHFIIHPNGKVYVSESATLEAAKAETEDDDIALHVTQESEGVGTGLEAIMNIHHLCLDGNRDSSLETLATTLVRAGMELQRQKTVEKVKALLGEEW